VTGVYLVTQTRWFWDALSVSVSSSIFLIEFILYISSLLAISFVHSVKNSAFLALNLPLLQASLMMTIINLAQNFVGSNNLNLLQPIGQFGTRLHGGKDSASPRYIFTMLRSALKISHHLKYSYRVTGLNLTAFKMKN